MLLHSASLAVRIVILLSLIILVATMAAVSLFPWRILWHIIKSEIPFRRAWNGRWFMPAFREVCLQLEFAATVTQPVEGSSIPMSPQRGGNVCDVAPTLRRHWDPLHWMPRPSASLRIPLHRGDSSGFHIVTDLSSGSQIVTELSRG